MSKKTETTYFCDNEMFCSSEELSGHGLPIGWVSVAYRPEAGKPIYRHTCSLRCLEEWAEFMQLQEETDEQG